MRLIRHLLGTFYLFFGRYLVVKVREGLLGRRKRTPEDTKASFSEPNLTYAEIPDFETFVFRDPGRNNYILLNGRLTWGPQSLPMRMFLAHLKDVIERYVEHPDTATVIEFGCGNGQNLLYLAKQFPKMRLVGIDIAAPRIATARKAAQKFGLNVEFHVGDVTQPQPALPQAADVCYSLAAIEQMPRVYAAALEAMVSRAGKAVLLFEPLPETWPLLHWRGVMSRIRASSMDYMRGLPRFLRERAYNISYMSLLDYNDDPYNPLTEIHLVPNPHGNMSHNTGIPTP